jgi:SsrA-binding protein
MTSSLLIAKNRKALHDYEILETFESGIVLQGTEVKSIREGRINLKDSYAKVVDGEIWLENCHISPYAHGNINNHEPLRRRKLLLHKREVNKLIGATVKKGLTLVPVSCYFREGKAKIELAIARGKREYDKRETARRKAIERDVQAELKRRSR